LTQEQGALDEEPREDSDDDGDPLLERSHVKGGPVDPLTKFERALELLSPALISDSLSVIGHPILKNIKTHQSKL